MDKTIENEYSHRFLFKIIGIFPFIDLVNGILLSSGKNIPIGSVYRIFLIAVLVYLFASSSSYYSSPLGAITIIVAAGIFIIISIQAVFFTNPISVIAEDVSTLFKYFMWLLIAVVFSAFERKRIVRMLLMVDCLFVLSMLLPYVLGLGNYTYKSSSYGYKSYFFATNDLTYVFVMLLTVVIYKFIEQFEEKNWRMLQGLLVLLLCNVGCMMLIGTKTGIVYSIVSLLILVIYLVAEKTTVPYQVKYYLFLIGILLSIFFSIFGLPIANKALGGLVNRIAYFYNLYDGNWLKILSSSRSIYLTDAYHNFLSFKENYLIFIFGFGYRNRWLLFGRNGGYIEMDFFDTLFSFGVVGLCLFLLPFIELFRQMSAKVKKVNRQYQFLILVTLLFSSTSGHVFYSALSTTIFGLICAIFLNKEEE